MGYSFSNKVLRLLLLVLLSQVGLSHQDAIQDLKEVILGRLDTIDNKLISMEAEIKQISELKDHVDNMDRNMFNAPVNDIKQQEINLLDQINLMKEEGGSSLQLLSNIINLLHGPIDNINNQIFVLDKTLKTSLMMMANSGEAEDPLTFLERPRDQVVINNHIASFTCHASGNLEPRIQWRKNTKPISGNSRYIVVDFPGGSILRIEPVKYQLDEANYECVAENPAGDIISAKARLTVLTDDPNSLPVGFPYFRSEPKTKAVEIDHTALLVCDARGNPDPTIIWYKNNQPVDINNPRYTVLRSGSLQISTSTEEDGGRYECVAENSAGTAFSKLVSLYVRVRRVPPLFSIAPDPAYEVMPGENLNISCVAVGSPMPYVKWKKMTPSVSGLVKGPAVDMTDNLITKNVLVLVDIQESANYTCQAQSTLGLVTQDVQVKVQEE